MTHRETTPLEWWDMLGQVSEQEGQAHVARLFRAIAATKATADRDEDLSRVIASELVQMDAAALRYAVAAVRSAMERSIPTGSGVAASAERWLAVLERELAGRAKAN